MAVTPFEAQGVTANLEHILRVEGPRGKVGKRGKREGIGVQGRAFALAHRAGTRLAKIEEGIGRSVFVLPFDDDAFWVFGEGDGLWLGHGL